MKGVPITSGLSKTMDPPPPVQGSLRTRLRFHNKEKEVGITANLQLQKYVKETDSILGQLQDKKKEHRKKQCFKKVLKKQSDPDAVEQAAEAALKDVILMMSWLT